MAYIWPRLEDGSCKEDDSLVPFVLRTFNLLSSQSMGTLNLQEPFGNLIVTFSGDNRSNAGYPLLPAHSVLPQAGLQAAPTRPQQVSCLVGHWELMYQRITLQKT